MSGDIGAVYHGNRQDAEGVVSLVLHVLEWRCTYLGDIVIVALYILEAEFLGGSDIPVCWLVGLRIANRRQSFLS